MAIKREREPLPEDVRKLNEERLADVKAALRKGVRPHTWAEERGTNRDQHNGRED